jgi:putative FmdB family regulatory protein
MPTYDYECAACGHRFELFQSITAKPQKSCPSCHRPKAKRLIGTGAGLIFKGSGFYITDYRSESYKQAAKSDSESSGAKKETSADAKASDSKAKESDTKAKSSNGTGKKS